MKQDKKNVIALTAIIVVIFLFYISIPDIRENINYVMKLLKEAKLDDLKDYILSFGSIGPLISIFILILQCLIAPLPLSLIVFAISFIYGWEIATIIACIGTLIGSSISFYISRIYGRPIAEKFVSPQILDTCDSIFERYGKKIIFASRLLPFVSFDGFSYAAGLTNIKFTYYFWATAVGQIPIIVALSLLGNSIGTSNNFIKGIIYCSVATLIAMIICYTIYRKKYNGVSIRELIKTKLKNM